MVTPFSKFQKIEDYADRPGKGKTSVAGSPVRRICSVHCCIWYAKDSYTITSEYAAELVRKRDVFQSVTGTKCAVHSIMITTDGVTRNEHWGDIQAEIQLDDLYEL